MLLFGLILFVLRNLQSFILCFCTGVCGSRSNVSGLAWSCRLKLFIVESTHHKKMSKQVGKSWFCCFKMPGVAQALFLGLPRHFFRTGLWMSVLRTLKKRYAHSFIYLFICQIATLHAFQLCSLIPIVFLYVFVTRVSSHKLSSVHFFLNFKLSICQTSDVSNFTSIKLSNCKACIHQRFTASCFCLAWSCLSWGTCSHLSFAFVREFVAQDKNVSGSAWSCRLKLFFACCCCIGDRCLSKCCVAQVGSLAFMPQSGLWGQITLCMAVWP